MKWELTDCPNEAIEIRSDDVTKIKFVKEVYLPKISLLVQIGDKLGVMVIVTIQANFRRTCTESSEQTGAYTYPPNCTNRLIFDKGTFFILFLSEYSNQSHNFTSLNFLTSIFSSLLLIHISVDSSSSLPYRTFPLLVPLYILLCSPPLIYPVTPQHILEIFSKTVIQLTLF